MNRGVLWWVWSTSYRRSPPRRSHKLRQSLVELVELADSLLRILSFTSRFSVALAQLGQSAVLNKALVSRPCSKSRTTNEPEPLRCLYDSSSIRVRFLVDDFTHRFSIARRVSYSSSPPILSHSSGPSQIPSQFLDPVHPSSIYR